MLVDVCVCVCVCVCMCVCWCNKVNHIISDILHMAAMMLSHKKKFPLIPYLFAKLICKYILNVMFILCLGKPIICWLNCKQIGPETLVPFLRDIYPYAVINIKCQSLQFSQLSSYNNVTFVKGTFRRDYSKSAKERVITVCTFG
jgi:hypothetical protein